MRSLYTVFLFVGSLAGGGCYSATDAGFDLDATINESGEVRQDVRDADDSVGGESDIYYGACPPLRCGVDPLSGVDCGGCPDGYDCDEERFCRWRCRQPTCERIVIPEGWFVRGSTVDPWPNAPRQEVWLDEYMIDRFEVTNERFLACVNEGFCPLLEYSEALFDPALARYPVVRVTFHDAETYCAWVGGMLPTEAQWEKAARGGCRDHAPSSCGIEDELKYPWGDSLPTCAVANLNFGIAENVCCDAECLPQEVGTHPMGSSIYGVEDMVGNASEMIREWYDKDAYLNCGNPCINPVGPLSSGDYRMVRGASSLFPGFAGRGREWRVDYRIWTLPEVDTFIATDDGFRCVYENNYP